MAPTLGALLRVYQDHPAVLEILIVNNANAPIDSLPEKAREIYRGPNMYVNPAWNLGAESARGELLLISNDDVMIDADVISFAVAEFGKHLFGIIGPHPSCFRGAARGEPRSRPAGQPLNGFGTLMFMRRKDYLPIPDDLLIWNGDDWLFWNQPKENRHLLGFEVETEMAVTTQKLDVGEICRRDAQWWVDRWGDIAKSQPWHAKAFRRNIPDNLRRSARGARRRLRSRLRRPVSGES